MTSNKAKNRSPEWKEELLSNLLAPFRGLYFSVWGRFEPLYM